jgi:hypothetical protein
MPQWLASSDASMDPQTPCVNEYTTAPQLIWSLAIVQKLFIFCIRIFPVTYRDFPVTAVTIFFFPTGNQNLATV